MWLVDGDAIDDTQFAAMVPWLSDSEAARFARFVRRERQRQFVLGRVLLRSMLGNLYGLPARSFVLDDRPGQAPLLQGERQPHFSISHSGRWIACAVSRDTALGLDIECIDLARDWRAVAQHAFGPAAAFDDADAFYQAWTGQEARFKLGADGHCVRLCHPGLSITLCSAQPLRQPIFFHRMEA